MNAISMPRLGRLMLTDLLGLTRSIAYGTVTPFVFTVIMYLIAYRRHKPPEDVTDLVVFGCCLIGGGLVITGMAFQDMHHPLGRNQYLMLPVSNLERILSRYLLTGPLLVIYTIVAFALFDYLGKQLVAIWFDQHRPLLSPFTSQTRWLVFSYLIAHVMVLTGAICFRTHALLKTILFVFVVIFGQALLELLMERILLPDAYSWTQLSSVKPPPVELMPWFTLSWLNVAAVIGIFAWLLRVAYVCLRDHEATDGV